MGVPGSLLWMHPLRFLFTIILISNEAKLIGLNHNQASGPAVSHLIVIVPLGATDCVVTGGGRGCTLGRCPVL